MPSPLTNFIAELRRRRVFRVAAFYGGIAFVITEIIGNTFSYLGIPDWFGTAIIVLLILGFPVSMILAWVFDITDEGIVRAKGRPADAKRKAQPLVGNKALAIIAALAILVAVWSWFDVGEKSPEIRSIAVLPLANLMNDPNQDYFVDGMTEALIMDLSKISALRVISRTSAMRFKDTDKSLPEIARELGVNAVVEGSVLRAGDRVRITAQLIGVEPERHLWAHSYERELRDILDLQREVARAIAREIKITLTPKEEARLVSTRPVNPEAYDAYLKGRYFWNKRTSEGIKKAIAYFEQAISESPDYALAYAGLADAYLIAEIYGFLPSEGTYPRARAAATKAIEIDNMLAEAHCSLAWIMATYDWNWKEAEMEFKYAIELNPSYANAPHWYAVFLSGLGRHEEAIVQVKRAQNLDPLSLIINDDVGWVLFLARKYDQAIKQYQKTLNMDPNFLPALHEIGLVYEQKGMFEKAISAFQKMASLSGDEWNASLAHAYALSGNGNQARKILAELIKLSQEEYVPPYEIATVYIGLKEKDEAFSWLENAYNERAGRLLWINVHPRFDPLHSDPRFADLLRRMNFPE